MMGGLRNVFRHCLRRVDARYRRSNHLQAVGPVLYAGRAIYRGPPMRFDDNTSLQPGEMVGVLHFNNDRFTRMEPASAGAAALGFARLMLESMHDLADRAVHDPAYRDLGVFHAVSWLPAHGVRIGFVSRPLPAGLRRRCLASWFRLLVWAYAPAPKSRDALPDPHFYWLTRKSLLDRFSADADAGHNHTAATG